MTNAEFITEKLENFLEPKLIEEIIKNGHFQVYKEGDIIIDYEKFIQGLPLVLSGTIRVMKRDEEGHEILLYYVNSNESCTMAYSCCMESKKSEIKAIADTDVKLISIPHDKLDAWLTHYPTWKTYIFQSFNHRFNELLKSLENIAFKKLDLRLIDFLKNKSANTGKRVISLTHQQIAEEMGTSRVVISRLLKQLENEGKVILYRNELKIMPNI